MDESRYRKCDVELGICRRVSALLETECVGERFASDGEVLRGR